jgi:PKD repeat protein
MKANISYFISLLILSSFWLNAQNAPHTIAPFILHPGPDVTVPIKVTNFMDIGAISLTLDYDLSIVQATGVTADVALPGFTSDWTTIPGRIVMGWFGTSGVTLPDYSVLVTIHFTGLVSGETDLTWMDDGGSCEYAKYDGGEYNVLNDSPVDIYYHNGNLAWQRKGPATIAPTFCAGEGTEPCVPFKVRNFTNIGAISLTLDYDPNVLEFENVTIVGIPGTWYFDCQAVVPGRLKIGGMGPAIANLPDDAVLFYVCFYYNGGYSDLTWYDGDEISCEYADGTTLAPLADRPMEDYYFNGSVGPTNLHADFSADNTTPLKSETVTFTDLSTGSPAGWEWSFDRPSVVFVNGTSSTSQNPQVQFTEGCLYTVTLIIHSEDGYCSDYEVKTGYIRVGSHGLWTGTFSTDWYTSDNWDDCLVPDATTDVLIPAAAPNWPFHSGNLSIDAQCRDITLDGAASQLTIDGKFMVPFMAAGIVTNKGTIIVKGDLENGNPYVADLGPGTVEFSGTVPQAITGLNFFGNLTLDNSAGLTLNADQRVNGTLALTNGILIIGSSNLTLGPSALTSGTFNSSAMVAADGTGQLRKEFSGPGSFLFPVGDITVDPDYSPVTLEFTSGTFSSGNYAAVNLTDDKYPNPLIVDNYLSRYWNLIQNNITGFTCNATFRYPVTDIAGDENLVYCLKAFPLPWVGYDPADAVTHKLTADGLTDFGTFTGAGIHKVYMKVFLEGFYNPTTGMMNKVQDEYGDHFPGNICDQLTLELHDPYNYSNIIYSSGLVYVTTAGNVYLSAIPGPYNADYYLTVIHRNHMETTSAIALSFAAPEITYNFTTAASQAYGDNQKDMGGVFALYGGEIVKDGLVDGSDMNYIDNLSNPPIVFGYFVEDLNGDGFVDASDMNICDNNTTAIIMAILP